jgi:hypothetical protein
VDVDWGNFIGEGDIVVTVVVDMSFSGEQATKKITPNKINKFNARLIFKTIKFVIRRPLIHKLVA